MTSQMCFATFSSCFFSLNQEVMLEYNFFRNNFYEIKLNFSSFFLQTRPISRWGTFYLLIATFFATQIIGGTKELVVLL